MHLKINMPACIHINHKKITTCFVLVLFLYPAFSLISLHEGPKFLNRAEVNHAPGSYVYTMGILYGVNFNMVDRTAGQLESTLRVLQHPREGF